MGRTHHLEPTRGPDLVGTEHCAHLVIENLGGRARQGAEAGMFQAAQELPDRQSERGSALVHLER